MPQILVRYNLHLLAHNVLFYCNLLLYSYHNLSPISLPSPLLIYFPSPSPSPSHPDAFLSDRRLDAAAADLASQGFTSGGTSTRHTPSDPRVAHVQFVPTDPALPAWTGTALGSFQVSFDFVLQSSAGRLDTSTVGVDGTDITAGQGLGLAQGALDVNGVWSDGSGGLVSDCE